MILVENIVPSSGKCVHCSLTTAVANGHFWGKILCGVEPLFMYTSLYIRLCLLADSSHGFKETTTSTST